MQSLISGRAETALYEVDGDYFSVRCDENLVPEAVRPEIANRLLSSASDWDSVECESVEDIRHALRVAAMQSQALDCCLFLFDEQQSIETRNASAELLNGLIQQAGVRVYLEDLFCARTLPAASIREFGNVVGNEKAQEFLRFIVGSQNSIEKVRAAFDAIDFDKHLRGDITSTDFESACLRGGIFRRLVNAFGSVDELNAVQMNVSTETALATNFPGIGMIMSDWVSSLRRLPGADSGNRIRERLSLADIRTQSNTSKPHADLETTDEPSKSSHKAYTDALSQIDHAVALAVSGNDPEVCITCPEHGDFWQAPGGHLSGSGCPQCGIDSIVKTTERFIDDAMPVHGDKYDYSKVEYRRGYEKVCITCPVHGDFWQAPDSHLEGRGCPKCGTASRSRGNTESFIEKAKSIHGDRYKYSNVEYVHCQTKVCITCPDHGDFWQAPHVHLAGSGCRKCGLALRAKKRAGNTESFIEKAKAIHGDNYKYSKVKYVNSYTKVCITCPEHGDFWQTPSGHLAGAGCPECGLALLAKKTRGNTESFIEKAKSIHGDRYKYSNVEYVHCQTKVCITCPDHGDFWQTPSGHLAGRGCSICSNSMSKGERAVRVALESRSVDYATQYSHESLKSERRLRFDFYVPAWNTLIEYDGEQHFRPVGPFGGETAFHETVKRDYAKNRWAIDNGYNLVRIPYWLLDDVDSIIQRLADANQSNSCSADDAPHPFQLMLFEYPGDKE